MRTLSRILPLLSFAALGADPKEAPCPMTGADLARVTGMKVISQEKHVSHWQTVACLFVMESGSVQLTRIPPESKNLKTEAELAAKLAVDEKRRLLKDFPVPTYSFTGGVTVVLPGGVWEVLVQRGPGGGLDPMKLGRALIDKQGH